MPVPRNLNGMTDGPLYYDTCSYEVVKNKQQSSTTLSNFVSGAIDFVVDFAGDEISVPYQILKSAFSIPNSYTVTSGDYTESKVKVVGSCRGIYVQDTNSIYGSNNTAIVRVYTGETGTARPYMVYHFATTTGIPEKSGWIADGVSVATNNFYYPNSIIPFWCSCCVHMHYCIKTQKQVEQVSS